MARNHRFNVDSIIKISQFAEGMLNRISDMEARIPEIDLSSEKYYFRQLLNKG